MNYTTQSTHTESENEESIDINPNQPLLPSSPSSSSTRKNSNTAILIPSSNRKRTEHNSTAIKLNRLDNRRANREKWGRIHIGILIISFFSIVYLCFSVNINIDKRQPQIIVDVPPVDDTLDGPRGKFFFLKFLM